MRIAIVAPRPVPYGPGGAERAWAGLRRALEEAGHEAEIVTAPVPERTLAEVGRAYRAFSDLDVSNADLVISSKYPAWITPHPRHVLWMFHPLRGLYDAYGAFGLPLAPGAVEPVAAELLAEVAGPSRRDRIAEVLDALDRAVALLGEDHPDLAHPGPVGRAVVHWLDRVALAPTEISRYVTLSRTIAARAEYLPDGVAARVAYAPSDIAPSQDAGPRRHLFTTSRLDGAKRIALVIAAMAHVPHDVDLLVGGAGPDEPLLRRLAGDDPRIRFLGRVPDADLRRLYAEAVAVPFVPLDEDYGLITVEAMACGAPVVTTTDAGGAAEMVTHGVDGLVVRPTPAAIGAALAALVDDPERAALMGEAGRRRAARITWPSVVGTLLGEDADEPDRTDDDVAVARPGRSRLRAARRGRWEPTAVRVGPARRRIVVLATFRVSERGHGGQLRSYHLYGSLAGRADVEVVCLPTDGRPGREVLAPGFTETAVPMSVEHREVADRASLAVGTPMTDLLSGLEVARTPAYLDRLREAADGADLAILAEPYMLPALAAAGLDLPFVYDAFNVEAELKRSSLPSTPEGIRALEEVVAIEERASREAAAITACSARDAAALTAAAGRPRRDAIVVPNGTDCAAHTVLPAVERARRGARWLARYAALDPALAGTEAVALFLGSWHPPNVAAANHLLVAAEHRPEVLFVLGGRHGDALAGRTLPRNVVTTGVLSSGAKDALLAAAHVALNPVTSGSGTNLKVIEYLAAGVPVVSTSFGVRGLDLVDGEHLVLDDSPTFSEGIRRVLDDPTATRERVVAGRARVEERYDWPILGEILWSVVERVAPKP